MMTSARIAATLCLVLLIIGQAATAPTDESADGTEAASDGASSEETLAKQDDAAQFEPATVDNQGGDELANADAEYDLPPPPFYYTDYTDYTDYNGDSDRNEQETLTRSGNLLLSPLGYRGEGLDSTNSGFPEIQQQHRISQTLNPAYLTNQGHSNYPYLQTGQKISQTLNPAYALNHNNRDHRGGANAAKLLYILGHLSNGHASLTGGRVGYGQYGHSSQGQPLSLGSLGGRISYGQTVIRQPANSNSFGSLGVINSVDSGTSSSGSNYDYLSSTGSSYPLHNLGGQSFIKLIRPIARFVAIQQTSPQEHWLTFLKNLNQAKLSGTGAYQTLNQQINYETQRQQRIILLLKRYRKIVAQRRDCPQGGK